MKVFISWSGDLSKRVGEVLRTYFPAMIKDLEVFMSQHDLESGARWNLELTKELELSSYGILCLSPKNLRSEWLLYEAGALSKHLESRVCGLLLDGLSPTDVVGPLAQFQHRVFQRVDVRTLLRDLNKKLEEPLEADQLRLVFDTWWPKLEKAYKACLENSGKAGKERKHRDSRELLEEILTKVRSMEISSLMLLPSQGGEGHQVLQRALTYDSLSWYTLWKFPALQISEFWQSRIMTDIDRDRYKTIGDLDTVVERAEEAVKAYSTERPSVFKAGTDYITKSLGFVDADFRERHNFGEATLDAFTKFGDLVSE